MSLDKDVDAALIKALPEPLKKTIDKLLGEHQSPESILAFCRQITGGLASLKGGPVYLAIEAYVAFKTTTKGTST